MKAKIISKIRNSLLEREELIIEIIEKVTPSKEEVKEFIGGEKDKIIVNRINANFGQYSFTADVDVYDSIESKKKIEVIPRKIKKKLAEEEKKRQEEEKAAKAAQATKTEGNSQ